MSGSDDPGNVHRAETEALRDGVALVAGVAADWIDLTGPDGVRFLHNLTTCDVRALAEGDSARGFFTDVQGHVLSDFDLVAGADRLRLRVPSGRGAFLIEHLAKYRIVERVDFALRCGSGVRRAAGDGGGRACWPRSASIRRRRPAATRRSRSAAWASSCAPAPLPPPPASS